MTTPAGCLVWQRLEQPACLPTVRRLATNEGMKPPFLRVLALPVLCWLALLSARAEEVTISLGMSYDKAVEAIQKCGGQDTGYLLQATGLSWWLGDYGVSLGSGEHYGKLNHLEYATTHNVSLIGDTGQRVEGQPAQSLTFDTEKRTFKAVNLPPASAPPPEHRWLTRTEVLFVALPTEKALALLPDLRDESKVDATYGQLIASIERKEARLIGDPVVYTPSDQKATTEASFEKIYPTSMRCHRCRKIPVLPRSRRRPTMTRSPRRSRSATRASPSRWNRRSGMNADSGSRS